ncbi:alpha/beta hydrolase [Bifidobacterium moukalabense]|uniref:alpha/beta hydrolase n=1 Tax=Bifidobacterium moukalabense TaxID=1333651 RepID=UPI0010F7CB65|nr:phospholipase [Bifidobacterium moukalabense]
MRVQTVTSIDFNSDDDLLFLGFHGFGNNETEMIRVINALYDGSGHKPNYISFRGTYSRPFVGNYYWYPDGCSTEERRRECHHVDTAVIGLLRSPAYARFRKVLIGFSQGGYLSYRMVLEHPDLFDAAILMSPSFKGEKGSAPVTGRTRFALCYGCEDHTIPVADQRTARIKLEQTGNLTYFEYPGMGHGICDAEIADLRRWMGL